VYELNLYMYINIRIYMLLADIVSIAVLPLLWEEILRNKFPCLCDSNSRMFEIECGFEA
jgi:hypothetical protein